jgi:parvulin-like peptidyl-prolyl isomerase
LRQLILQDVASFAALAKTESDCPSANRQGDLGFFARGKMTPAFEAAAFALGIGELSDIIQTESGFHLILRTA